MIFSILICCYNSANIIEDTLRHLATIVIPDKCEAELIVVDNNSKDGTASIVNEIWKSLGSSFPLEIWKEGNQGKSFALKTGVKKSKGDIIIICDDDNHLHSDYLLQIQSIVETHKHFSIFGPAITAVSNSALPDWFTKEQGYYAIGQPHREFEERFGYGIPGAGMVCKKSLFTKLINDENKK